MEGMCACGGKVRESNHFVASNEGARKWYGPDVKLPIHVEQSRCSRCGRQMTRLFDADGVLVSIKG